MPTTFDRYPPGLCRALVYRGWWLVGAALALPCDAFVPDPAALRRRQGRPVIALEALAAAYGDSLLVECARPGRPPYRILVDGGPPEAWGCRPRATNCPPRPSGRRLDLVIVPRIDTDHIAGAVRLLADDLGLELGDVWFSALAHLPAPAVPAGRSVDEGGETLAALLAGAAGPARRALEPRARRLPRSSRPAMPRTSRSRCRTARA